MARDGGTKAAAAKTAEPQDAYDNLSLDEQDAFDGIAGAGFKPVAAGRGWAAEPVQEGGTKIGPFPDLFQLKDAVVEASGIVEDEIGEVTVSDEKDATEGDGSAEPAAAPGKVVKLDADGEGNRYLEGMEPVVDQELAAAAGSYHAFKTDRVNLLNKELQAKETLKDIVHRKRHLFKMDPHNTDAKIYKIGDLTLRIKNKVTEEISTAIERDGGKKKAA